MRNARIAASVVFVLVAFAAGNSAARMLRTMHHCPPWQIQRSGGGARCVPRPCARSLDCGGTACVQRRVCVAGRTESQRGPGPCVDANNDGRCDDERPVSVRVELGPCGPRDSCTEGRCTTVRECAPPPGSRGRS